MNSLEMFRTLFAYNAWANDDLLRKMEGFDAKTHQAERHTAIRLLNHAHVVGRIFAGHLSGEPHGYASDNTAETPSLPELRAALTASGRWYRDHLGALAGPELSERIAFTFTDGDKGCMTRGEMLLQVILHSGYHRGEVGRIMGQLALPLPWDTFAVYLHQADPSRRLRDAAA